jgi:HemY protein
MILWLILALLLGASVATVLVMDNGYVLIRYANYTVESSLSIIILGVFFTFILMYLSVRVWVWLRYIPREMLQVWESYQLSRGDKELEKGFISQEEGQLRMAERSWLKSAKLSRAGLASYLMAARAAQALAAYDRRDQYFEEALKRYPRAEVSLRLARAELMSESQELEAALALVETVLKNYPSHRQALFLKSRLYEKQADWQALSELLPSLRSNKAVTPEVLERLHLGVFRWQVSHAGDRAALNQLWNQLNRQQRKHAEFFHAYAQRALALGDGLGLSKPIQEVLKVDWHLPLLRVWLDLPKENNHQALNQVEKWLQTYPDDASLYLIAGELSARQEMWGLAQAYLTKACEMNPNTENQRALGRMFVEMGQRDRALDVLLADSACLKKSDTIGA